MKISGFNINVTPDLWSAAGFNSRRAQTPPLTFSRLLYLCGLVFVPIMNRIDELKVLNLAPRFCEPSEGWFVRSCTVSVFQYVGEALGGLTLEKTCASSCTHMVRRGLFVLILGVLGYKEASSL